ncbi:MULTISPECIES: murein biosynthesis integral membrane protein MurJ [Kordiimonas]|uniref:murein biosynthesis integral membrane protein MurJ n=1 Tax=Kordiimonas TaxID=288021 RepID=UPI00257DEC7C|nr:murein biosynthesis integral membrane protein MurJ [Kordiimonas sp. UBA4487]
MSLAKRISTVGGFTLLSRVFGFIRDVLMARYLGAGMASDAFFIAFKLPNFFRRLFAEGAFSVGFVPLFARALGKDITPESQQAALDFASRVFAWLLPILLVFLLIMEAAMVPVMLGLTGGFDGDQTKFDLTVELGRYTFPYLALISLVTFYAGMLNAMERYSAAAFAPVILNIFMIGALIAFGESEIGAARALAAAVSLSGIAQFLWLVRAAMRAGLKVRLALPKPSEDVRELMRVIAPAAIGAGIIQINLLIDVLLAARFLPEGSVSWLFYADRLNQLPLGVIGVAVGTVLLPSISRLLAGGDEAGALRQQNRAIEFSLFLTLPSAVALAVIPGPIIATLFERGAFTSSETGQTAAALMAYALGLPAYVIAKALTPGYFARKDTKTPVKFATASLVVNLVLNLILIQSLAHVGLALATAIAAWFNVLLLYLGLRRSHGFHFFRETLVRLAKMITASLVMAAGIYLMLDRFSGSFTADGAERIGALAIMVVAGAALYFIAIIALRTLPMDEIRKFVKR